MARYCTYCGNEVNEHAVVCVKCGCAIPQANDQTGQGFSQILVKPSVVDVISKRVKTNGIIWIVVAAIQILLGLVGAWFLLIVGVLNLISSIQDLKYSKAFPQNPTGIIAKVKPLAGPIITLIYNLLIGGVIGVIGSVYYLVAVRGYVLENEQAFLEIERGVTPATNKVATVDSADSFTLTINRANQWFAVNPAITIVIDGNAEYKIDNGATLNIPITAGTHNVVFSCSFRNKTVNINATNNVTLNIIWNRTTGNIVVE